MAKGKIKKADRGIRKVPHPPKSRKAWVNFVMKNLKDSAQKQHLDEEGNVI